MNKFDECYNQFMYIVSFLMEHGIYMEDYRDYMQFKAAVQFFAVSLASQYAVTFEAGKLESMTKICGMNLETVWKLWTAFNEAFKKEEDSEETEDDNEENED